MEKRIQNENIDSCIALGFFDCVHLGHRAILDCAKDIAQNKGLTSAVFTFSSLDEKDERQVYLLDERKEIYSSLGIEKIIVYEFTNEIKNTSPRDFLDGLVEKYNAKAFVCGKDYRFGKNAQGTVETLKDYCSKRGITLKVIDDVVYQGDKICSTLIKKLMSEGNINTANILLGENYFINGKVVHGRGEGKFFGFPTANLTLEKSKIYPEPAVYATYFIVEGKTYRAVTNLGNKPTFSDETYTIESYIDGFSGDLYGKEVKISFVKKLRERRKFSSPKTLCDAIMNDIKWEK